MGSDECCGCSADIDAAGFAKLFHRRSRLDGNVLCFAELPDGLRHMRVGIVREEDAHRAMILDRLPDLLEAGDPIRTLQRFKWHIVHLEALEVVSHLRHFHIIAFAKNNVNTEFHAIS